MIDLSKYGIKEAIDITDEFQQLKQENEELKKSVAKNKEKRKQATEKYQKLKDFTTYGVLEQKIEKIKEYIENMLKCSTGHTQTYYDILTIIEEE